MSNLEFHVELATENRILSTFDEACGLAVAHSASTGKGVNIDVITWTREAAVDYGGDYGGEVYDEDPEASVHDRITINADSLGRIA